MTRVTVLFFGPAKDWTGCDSTSVDLAAEADLGSLQRALGRRYPALRPALPTVRFAVNETFADADRTLHSADVIALIPPVSGG